MPQGAREGGKPAAEGERPGWGLPDFEMPKEQPLNAGALSAIGKQFEDGSSKWGDLFSAMVVSDKEFPPRGATPFNVETMTYSTFRGEGRVLTTGIGSAFSSLEYCAGKLPSEAALRVRAEWCYFTTTVADRNSALDRYQSLAERAWQTIPPSMRERFVEAPWIDPRAAMGDVHRWTTLVHVAAWRGGGSGGISAPRSVFNAPRRRHDIEILFQEATRLSPTAKAWSDVRLSEWSVDHVRDAHISWPPKWFESLLTPDLFLASKLAIDYVVTECASLAGTTPETVPISPQPLKPNSTAKVVAKRPELRERHENVLTAMLELNATSNGLRKSAADIAMQVCGRRDPSKTKATLVELREWKLVDSLNGRSGGYWLTARGIREAKRLS